ncbi:hypothetical protein C8R44DRAFT_865113 [Mycena epipterygia]|nr:hypothetical protein C8R44DRAFT_865113 [Mycena epipterygia]
MVVDRFSSSARRTLIKRLSSLPLPGQGKPIPTQCFPTFQQLPTEIFLEIAGFLQDAELLQFSLTSSQWRRLLLPQMYKTIVLESSRACMSGLTMLSRHPELCPYIRILTVRPNHAIVCWPRTDGPVSESKVAFMIEQLAENLKNLKRFEWGGSQLPPDTLWKALRTACPELNKISSTAGSILDPECELFKFDNLTALSLTAQCFHLSQELGQLALPIQLWTMLLQRCPNLEELTLRLFYSSHSLREIDQLMSAVFPNLRSLRLEIWYSSDPSSDPSPHLLGPFLSAHPNLRELSIFPYSDGWFPDVLPLFLAPTALPRLRSFVGIYQHLTQLPHPEALEALDLTGDPVSGLCITTVAAALRRLSSLRSLDIRVADAQDGAALLRSVISACSGLTTLRVMFPVNFGMVCSTPLPLNVPHSERASQKTLREISATLHHLPHLRSLTLYKGHRLTYDTMLRCALLLLADHPGLGEIHLAWFAWERGERRQNGSYVVLADMEGGRYLDVWERGVRSAGVGGGVFDRKFRYALEGKGKGKGRGDLRGSVVKGLARIRR